MYLPSYPPAETIVLLLRDDPLMRLFNFSLRFGLKVMHAD
jgi:hypothetical protein